MIEGPRRLGSEYVKPWIQLPIDSEESSRIRVGMPFSFRAGHTRHTRKRGVPPTTKTRHMRARGRSTRAMNRTSPLSRPRNPIDVANEARFTRDPAIPTADEVKRCAARAQNAKPKIEFEMLPANTQPPCSRTSSDSDIGPVETVGFIQGNSQPSMTPTNGGRDTEAIRISRNGLGAKPVIILPTGDGLHGLAHAIEGEVDSEPKFYSRRTIFSDTAADSENFLCVFDRRPQIDKYCAKIPWCAGDPDSERWSPASAPERTRMPRRRASAVRVRVTSAPSWRSLSWIYGSTASAPWRRRFSSSLSRSSARACSQVTSWGSPLSLREERCETRPLATSISSSSS